MRARRKRLRQLETRRASKVEDRLKDDLRRFITVRGSDNIDWQNPHARYGMWRRFRGKWRRKEIEQEELGIVRAGLTPEKLVPQCRAFFESTAKKLMQRIDEAPEAVLFRRHYNSRLVLFIGKPTPIQDIESVEQMSVLAAAWAAEECG